MSTIPQWKNKLDILRDYIASNPEIYIDMREISIPEHLRDRFYEYFDDIRNTYVEDFFNSLPLDVDTLRDNYIQSEKESIKCLGIERIDLPVDLLSFLHNPREGMVRWLYNRLFELIQNKISMEEFEQMAENDLASTTAEMYRLGYEAWAVLALIVMLDPDEAWSVELNEDDAAIPGELKEIAFGRQFNHSVKRMPEFIVHSKKLDRFVAVKMPLAREVDAYYPPHEIPQKMFRDRTGDTSYVLDSRIVFLSMLDNMDKIPVYAEIHKRKIISPDMMIEFLTEQDLADTDKMSQILYRINFMKPKQGGTVVIMNPGAEPVSVSEGIDLFSVGFEKAKLESIIDKLMAGKEN